MAALPRIHRDVLKAARQLDRPVAIAVQTHLGNDVVVTREGTTFKIRKKDSNADEAHLQLKRLLQTRPSEGLGWRVQRFVRTNTPSWVALISALTVLVLVTEVRRRSRNA